MDKSAKRYADMERYITLALIASLLLFIVFLVASGCGIVWLKILVAIFAILIPGLCLYVLYLTKELLRQRSLWMSVASAAIIICILFSLILNYPSPKPVMESGSTSQSTVSAEE
jgi:cytochrome bd-type quinol oxidase subunit 2